MPENERCMIMPDEPTEAHLDGDELKIEGCLRLRAGTGGCDSEAQPAEDGSGSDASSLGGSPRKNRKNMRAGAASGSGGQEINNDGCNNGISRAIPVCQGIIYNRIPC